MPKFFSVLTLVVIIAASLAFVLVKTAAISEEDNWFNRNYRQDFASILILRKVFALNLDGDAKTDYLGDRRSKIIVEVDEIVGSEFKLESLEAAAEEMEKLTGKSVVIIRSSKIVKTKSAYSQDDMVEIYDTYKIQKISADKAIFYLVSVPRNEDDKGLVGRTIKEDGAVIFANAIADLGRENIVEIEASTILHEFGHLLGLPHLEGADCIMNETLEVGRRKQKISTGFCEEELQLLENIKLDIN